MDILQNFESFEENLRSTAQERKISQAYVAGLKQERTVLKTTIDRLQNDLTSNRDEVAGLEIELAEWLERYDFQFAEGAGAN